MTAKRRWRRTPYQKIIRAIESGATTLTLNSKDLDMLNLDTAIRDRADSDDEAEQEWREKTEAKK